jgi:hypothetical protein
MTTCASRITGGEGMSAEWIILIVPIMIVVLIIVEAIKQRGIE